MNLPTLPQAPWPFLLLTAVLLAAALPASADVKILEIIAEKSMTRAQRPLPVRAVVRNGQSPATLSVRMILPQGLTVLGEATQSVDLGPGQEADLRWIIISDRPCRGELKIEVRMDGVPAAEASMPFRFLPPAPPMDPGYIPEPRPAQSPLLVGAHHCPLWETSRPDMWRQIRTYPDRTPALGFYSQDNPEVADWETIWAAEHGVDFFIYCWYRTSQGGPVETMFESAITEGLFKSRYQDQIQFTIMWENQRRGVSGVADEKDLKENLFPYWMETFFKHPSYLKVDNKPHLYIYRPEFLVQDLGGEEAVVKAFDWMRQACRKEGFDGLTLLGEYRGLDPKHLDLMKRLGLDYTFAYCWHVPNNPDPETAIATQMEYIRKTEELNILPQVVTVTQGWTGWHNEGSVWKLPSQDYKTLLREADSFLKTMSKDHLGSQILILDNWNEWGEGHYLGPHVDEGFGYLDAIREVLTDPTTEHTDLIPEDLGLGPYDEPYRKHMEDQWRHGRTRTRHVVKDGWDDPDLVAWWAFDEEEDLPVALDYSGNGMGGITHETKRVDGVDGGALSFNGGSVTVPHDDRLNPGQAITLSCWVKADIAGQDNNWIVNRVYQAGDAGYRLGILHGAPCFQVPETTWSHHLAAEGELPAGKWIHLAGTFDGQTIRLFVDGILEAKMDRPGKIKDNAYPLTIGSYERGHPAHFKGAVDEVKIWRRALSEQEIKDLL